VIDYPSGFPCVSRIGHGATLGAGLVRSPIDAGATRQRRAHEQLPHRIALLWDMSQAELADWLPWVNAHAWDDWVRLPLPGLLASRAGVNVTPTPVRFTSDLTQELIPTAGLWYWRIGVEAEYVPTGDDLAVIPLGGWIVAGSPAAPSSPDWIIAGTPPTPSNANRVLAGTPADPSGWI